MPRANPELVEGEAEGTKVMPNFKIADDCRSFHCLSKSCGQACSKKRGCKKTAPWEKCSDYLVRAAYLFCSALIVYSLLVFNGLLSGDSQKPGNNFLIASATGAGAKISEIWLDTVIFMDKTGSAMGEPLVGTIQIYSNALTKAFVTTGNFLAKVPEIFASPPYAKAKGYMAP